jgi:hypothetical protein
VVWWVGTALIVVAGYALQRWRPQVLSAVTDTGATPLARALTAARAPGSVLTLTAFNLDPLVGSSAALAQLTDSAAADAVLIIVAVVPPIAVLVFTARYIRMITAAPPRRKQAVQKGSSGDAKPVCYFDPAVVTCPDGTPRWLQMLCFGEGAWGPWHHGPLWRVRLVLASFASTTRAIAAFSSSPPHGGCSSGRRFGHIDPRYFFFVTTAASCVTSVLRGVRFNCAAQLWLLAVVQGALLVAILSMRPFVVPAKTLLSAAMSALITLGMLLLAVDFSTRDADGSSGGGLSKAAEAVALAATALSVPKTSLTVLKLLVNTTGSRRRRRRIESHHQVREAGSTADPGEDMDFLCAALLAPDADTRGVQPQHGHDAVIHVRPSATTAFHHGQNDPVDQLDADLQLLLSDGDDDPVGGVEVFVVETGPLDAAVVAVSSAGEAASEIVSVAAAGHCGQEKLPDFAILQDGDEDDRCVDRAAAVRRVLDVLDTATPAEAAPSGTVIRGGGVTAASAADIRSRLAALGLRRRDAEVGELRTAVVSESAEAAGANGLAVNAHDDGILL